MYRYIVVISRSFYASSKNENEMSQNLRSFSVFRVFYQRYKAWNPLMSKYIRYFVTEINIVFWKILHMLCFIVWKRKCTQAVAEWHVFLNSSRHGTYTYTCGSFEINDKYTKHKFNIFVSQLRYPGHTCFLFKKRHFYFVK